MTTREAALILAEYVGLAGDDAFVTKVAAAPMGKDPLGFIQRIEKEQIFPARDAGRAFGPADLLRAVAPVGAAITTRFAEVERRRVAWLWPSYVPCGMMTLLEGDPGTGKSTMLIDLVARVTRGLPMPDGTGGGEPGTVVLLSAEDDPNAVIVPRLEAAGADLGCVVMLRMKTESGLREPTISDADAAELERVAVEEKAALMVVDPLVAYLPGTTDTGNDHSVRLALLKLRPVPERTGCALICVRHWKKGEADKAIHKGGGSVGFSGAARAVLAVAIDPEDESRQTRILAVAKANLAPIAPSLTFCLYAPPGCDVPHVQWTGVSRHGADSLVAAPKRRGDRVAQREAEDFLRVKLSAGAVPTKEVEDEAKAKAISLATLRRARKDLRVVAEREGGIAEEGRWVLRFPNAPGDAWEDADE